MILLHHISFAHFLKPNISTCYLFHFAGMAISFIKEIKDLTIPIVFVFHEGEISDYLKNESYRQRLHAVFELATKILFVSNYMKELVINMGCPPNKVDVWLLDRVK